MTVNRGQTGLALAIIILFAFLLRIYFFGGIAGTDDVFIARGALRLLDHGWFLPEEHHLGRVGLWLPLVPVIHLFGAGEWQIAWLPLAYSVLIVWLAAAVGRRLADAQVGLMAAVLAAVFPLDVVYGTTLFPDLALGALCGLTVLLALRTREARHPTLMAVLAGAVWGWAYLTKIEAAMLLPAIIALWAARYITFRSLFVIGVAVAVVVVAENVIYYLASGKILYRLTIIKGGTTVTEAYSGAQWWVFPKSWFLTFYDFGLHYYALFAGMIWALLRRSRGAAVLLVWSGTFLLWLQFGANPFVEGYQMKSHLSRYCSMLSVPAAVIAAMFLWRAVGDRSRRLAVATTAGVVAVSLFMINFDRLSYEGQTALKSAMAQAERKGWFPIYLDSTSRTIASIWWWGQNDRPYFTLGDVVAAGTNGQASKRRYALVNPSSMLFRHRRYGSDITILKWLEACGTRVLTIDNPLPGVVYAQAQLLGWLGGFVPPIAEKVSRTTRELLQGDDAVVYALDGGAGRNCRVPSGGN